MMMLVIDLVILDSYDKGAHIFLPSYIMRTHGSRQQREAVKRAPANQLQPIFQVHHFVLLLQNLHQASYK